MDESKDERTKRTKLQQEQDRFGYEAAVRLQKVRVEADEELAQRLQAEERNNSKRAAEAELDYEGSKRQKTNKALGSVREQLNEEENALSQEDLQKMMMVVLVEEFYVEALQVKYPIIDWRDDLVMLWSLVKERISLTEPTDDNERTLWVELKRLFEPDTNDTLWKH
uniref:Uncharacterized protein n=1 Tax=Tanacetum cinerariifolium TaxID=118510 RepID=A0A6L2J8D7_TANCI|nr:hypothetical protein [Tanacetum cinerariifolium]